MLDYTNLHTHSEFSLLDGAAKVKDLALLAKEHNHKYLSLTDHGSLSGVLHHKKYCESFGIKPIYGCEIYLAEEFNRIHEENFKFKNLHLTILAKNQRGFEKIIKGLNYANQYGTAKSGRAKRPFIPVDYPLVNNWADDIIILSGCSSSPFYHVQNKEELYKSYADLFGEDFYGEIMPLHDMKEQIEINKISIERAVKVGRKVVCTNDIHYCNAKDWEMHEVILNLSMKGMTKNNPHWWKFDSHLNYFRTGDEMLNSLITMGFGEEISRQSILNTSEIAEKCYFNIEKYPIDLPSISANNNDEFLNLIFDDWISEGFEKRNCLNNDIYKSRLLTEKEMIKSKGFVRYILIVADMLKWAKSQGILIGPARGSSAGSLVCYVLGITDIDPIKHNLRFERFISPSRINLPDIDTDIPDSQRYLVEQYLRSKYGTDNIAHVGTYQTMYGRSALRDVARLYEVPLGEVDQAAKMLIKRHESHIRADKTIQDTYADVEEFRIFAKKYPEVVLNAAKLEGHLKNTGIHAAGFVISNNPIKESNRTYLIDGNDSKKAVNWSQEDLEFFGYIKIDLLGLNTLSVISECLRLIKEHKNINIDLNSLPLYDEKTYQAMAEGHTATIFQINTPSFTAYCKELKPENFEDIAALTALWRPGPIGAGQTKAYVDVRHGRIKPSHKSEIYSNIVKNSRGQLIYQEQVTDLLTQMAGFDFTEADEVRKIIAKSEGSKKLIPYLEKFINGCKNKGTLEENEAKILWESLYEFGRYCFNLSHATSYGLLTYWTMYLKVHYPTEYLCAYLNYGSIDKENNEGETNLDIALRECHRLGIQVLRPDINESNDSWTIVGEKKLRAGLKEVRYVGDNARIELMKAKSQGPINSFQQFLDRIERRIINKRVIHSLLFCGALDSLDNSEIWKKNYEELYELLGKKKFNDIFESSRIGPIYQPEEELLNYSEKSLFELETIGKSMAKVLGMTYSEEYEAPTLITNNGEFYGVYEAKKGIIGKIPVIKQIKYPKEILDSIKENTLNCFACPIRSNPECTGPVPFERGRFNVMILAESPGYYEDQKGVPLIGKSGKLLFSKLEESGISRNIFYITNCISCKPEGNKLPSIDYVDKCIHAKELMKVIKPKLVLALGNKALYFFKKKESGIMALSGTTEWNTEYECFVSFCIHPSLLLHGERPSAVDLWNKGLNEFIRMFRLLQS